MCGAMTLFAVDGPGDADALYVVEIGIVVLLLDKRNLTMCEDGKKAVRYGLIAGEGSRRALSVHLESQVL